MAAITYVSVQTDWCTTEVVTFSGLEFACWGLFRQPNVVTNAAVLCFKADRAFPLALSGSCQTDEQPVGITPIRVCCSALGGAQHKAE